MKRGELIEQLRHALYMAESPNYDAIEFDIGDTNIVIEEFEEEVPACIKQVDITT